MAYGKFAFAFMSVFAVAAVAQAGSEAEARTVKFAVIEAKGFCTAEPAKTNAINGGSDSDWIGFIPDVVRELGRRKSFLPSFQRVSDGMYGRYNETTGKWTGLIGDVIAGRADFAAAALTASAQREEHVDFTHELLDIGLVVLAKRPDRLTPVQRGAVFFLSVFDAGVWCSLLAVFCVTACLLHFNYRKNPREFQARLAEHAVGGGGVIVGGDGADVDSSAASAPSLLAAGQHYSLAGCAFYTLSTACFQGYEKSPKSLAGRCLSLFWWAFVCIFAATYAAGLLCALVGSDSGQENKFAYLDARDQFKVDPNVMQTMVPVWLSGGHTDRLMRNSSDPLFRLFYNLSRNAAKKDPRLTDIRNISQLIEIVSSAHHFYGIVESPIADYYAKKKGCQLVVLGSLLNDKVYAFAYSETGDHSLKDQVNAGIIDLHESGFIRAAYRKHFGGQFSQCNPAATDSVASAALSLAGEEIARMFRDSLPITLRTFSGAIVMYFMGMVLSLVAGAIDVYIFGKTAKHQQGAQVLRTNAPEDEEEPPSFRDLAYSDERRQEQEQRQLEQPSLEDDQSRSPVPAANDN